MNTPREIKKAEAIHRMRCMGIIKDAINQFDKEDIVMVCEPPIGGLYWLNDEEKKMVQEFEQEHNALVYLVVRSFTNIGQMDNIFYVSDHEEEWYADRDDIAENLACVYVKNYDMPDCSEFGTIAYRGVGGGILRRF